MKTAKDVYEAFCKARADFLGERFFPVKNFPPNQPDRWVIRKTGSNRASRVFHTKEEAKEWMKSHRNMGYRTKHYKGRKMIDAYISTLEYAAKYFNTKWSNIDMVGYFQCGFEIFGKSFSYVRFFEKRIMRLYIERDKAKKINSVFCKKSITASMKFVINYMKENNIATFGRYCMLESNGHPLPVKHYLDNKIDQNFLIILSTSGLLTLKDSDISFIPYIAQRYREICMALDEIKPFTLSIKERINKWENSMIS